MKISCPRCMKQDILDSGNAGYIDVYNLFARYYRCNSCRLVFFIQIPFHVNSWRLLEEAEITFEE
jgi:hypothetical protein